MDLSQQSVVQLLRCVQLLETPWTAEYQTFLSTISRSLLKLMFVESVMPPNHLILCFSLLLLLSIFPIDGAYLEFIYIQAGRQSQ